MNTLSLPWRNLTQRPTRSALTLLGVSLSVAAYVALAGLSRGIDNAARDGLAENGIHLIVTERGVVDIFASALPLELEPDLRAIDGVTDVAGDLAHLVPAEANAHVLLNGWATGSFLWDAVPLVAGELPSADRPRSVILGSQLAESLEKRPGDSIELLYEPFEVVGIAEFDSLMNDNRAILPLPDMQELTFREGVVTVFHLQVDEPHNPEAMAAIRDAIDGTWPRLRTASPAGITQDNRMVEIFQGFGWAVSAIALVMAVLIVVNTLVMSVTERKQELAILSAIGWGRVRVIAMIVTEGMMLTAIGSTAGVVLGIGSASFVSAMPAVQGLVQPEITGRLLIEVVAAVLALGALASFYPAWRTTRMVPVTALQGQ